MYKKSKIYEIELVHREHEEAQIINFELKKRSNNRRVEYSSDEHDDKNEEENVEEKLMSVSELIIILNISKSLRFISL